MTPDFANMIVYQVHIGTYAISQPGIALDVSGYHRQDSLLVAFGINVLQPLPVDEVETDPSMGYDGADYFSPDFPYVVTDPSALAQYLATINSLLPAKGLSPLALNDIVSGPAQLKGAGRSLPRLRNRRSLRRGLQPRRRLQSRTTGPTTSVFTTSIARSPATTTTACTSPIRTAAPVGFRSHSGITTCASS